MDKKNKELSQVIQMVRLHKELKELAIEDNNNTTQEIKKKKNNGRGHERAKLQSKKRDGHLPLSKGGQKWGYGRAGTVWRRGRILGKGNPQTFTSTDGAPTSRGHSREYRTPKGGWDKWFEGHKKLTSEGKWEVGRNKRQKNKSPENAPKLSRDSGHFCRSTKKGHRVPTQKKLYLEKENEKTIGILDKRKRKSRHVKPGRVRT